ncbi:MAG: endonuclease/exonuclease/phosphatase family protein, partial [Candidatus Heimdallarchaeota archaeon]|nr:endonuclease/exonuclease/phosphatase family protein [Candidatus Heimdallarchaeota archaeon]
MGFQFNIVSGEWAASRSDANIRVLSMNIGRDREVGIRFNYEKFIELIKDTKPDIIALQEAGNPSLLRMIEKAFPSDTWHGSFKEGFSIISKMEMNDQEMDWDGRRGAIRKYQIKNRDHVITFFNVHFMTPRPGFEALLTNGFSGIDMMKRITEVQRKEASMASRAIGSNANIIIAGDFNMSSIHPIYRKNWSSFLDAFSQKGFGFGYTKYLLFHGVRIDHVLCSSNWKIINAMVGPSLDCDHRPLIVDLKFIGRSGGNEITKELPGKGGNESILDDWNLFHYENFKMDAGSFESYGTGKLIVDYEDTYLRGNSLKIKRRSDSKDLKAGIKF